MKIVGKVVRKDDELLLECQIGPKMIDDVALEEFLEEFEDEEVLITIQKTQKRFYSKKDHFTEGGERVE